MLQTLIPMAGRGSRFVEAGYSEPKPFIPIQNKPMIEWVVDNLRVESSQKFIFLCQEDHLKAHGFAQRLKDLVDSAFIIPVFGLTEGAAATVLLARDSLQLEDELLLANSDQWVETDISLFLEEARSTNCDGLIMSMPATDAKWSFAKVDAAGFVTEVAEKKVISDTATVGIYYFRKAKMFVEAADEMIRKNIRTNGEFYVCPAYNEMISQGLKVRVFDIGDAMHGLGTPEDLEAFESWLSSRLA